MKVLLPFLTALTGVFALPLTAVADTLGKPGVCLYLLTANNEIVSLCETDPAVLSPVMPVTGLAADDVLVSIDVRPVNQDLYGLARNSSSGTLQLYHLAPATGTATAVGAPITLLDAGNHPVPTNAARFGMDFNPVVDRLRIVASNGLNLRVNPNTGALTAMDTAISGLSTTLDECAYTNNQPGSAVTTLYTIDSATDCIYTQNPPNNGTQTTSVPVTLSGVPVNFTAALGFDLAPGVDVLASNTAATGKAYAILTIGGATGLYRIDLATGAATALSTTTLSIRGLAVRTQISYAVALDAAAQNLIRFHLDSPSTFSTVTLGAPASGETLVGLDYRPATGQLYGLGINTTTHTGTLYLVDPAGGSVSAMGTAGSIAFTSDGVTAIPLPDPGTGYGFDFNPTVDRIRVVTGDGLNFRINPVTGAPVDGDTTTTGTNPDVKLNGGATATAAGYTNSYAGATTTSLYVLDAVSNQLLLQNPPNNGTLILGKTLTLNGSTLDFSAACNLDILPESGAQAGTSQVEPGSAVATLSVGGLTGLYRIDLVTGATTSLGQIGAGGQLRGFAVSGEMGAGSAPFTWVSSPGASYRIETSTNLTSWQPLPGTVKATQSSTTVPVPRYLGEPRRFWRSVVP